jgi:WD40 repeat protein
LSGSIPKITDFGLAKDWTSDRRLTQSWVTMGTPSNMAPEQARHTKAEIGPATDVYALGTVLYEMLTGRPPFDADSPVDTIAQVLNDEPISPLRLRHGLPRDLATICLKCLEKAPSQRYANALDLAEDLRRFQAHEPIRARPIGFVGRTTRWCRRRPLVSGLLALSSVLAVTLISYAIMAEIRVRNALEAQVVHLNVEIGLIELGDGDTFQAILHFAEALRRDEGSPRESEDRQHIAQALRQCPELVGMLNLESRILCSDIVTAGDRIVTVDSDHVVTVWDLTTHRPVIGGLKHADGPRDGALSPDGRYLAVLSSSNAARIWDLTTGTSKDLPKLSGAPVERFRFHPESTDLLTHHADGAIRLWSRDPGSGTWSETTPQHLAWTTSQAWPSEDGRWLLTVDARHDGLLWMIGNAQAPSKTVNLEKPVNIAAMSGDGRRLAVHHADGEAVVWDMQSHKRLGRPIQAGPEVRRFALSADGERLAFSSSAGIQVWHSDGAKMLAHFKPKEHVLQSLQFSPGGRFLLTQSKEDGAHVWDVERSCSASPLFKHSGQLAAAGFGAKSGQVRTVDADGLVCFWRLSHIPDLKLDDEANTLGPALEQRRAQALMALAEALAGNRLDENGERRALDGARLLQAWKRWNESP